MGGQDGTSLTNWVYESTDLITWKRIDDAKWSARAGHKGVVLNGKIFIMGGQDYIGNLQNDVQSWDGHDWYRQQNADWRSRTSFCAFVKGGEMLIYGGAVSIQGRDVSDDMWSSPDGSQWDQVTTTLRAGGSMPEMVAHQCTMFINTIFILGTNWDDRNPSQYVSCPDSGEQTMCRL